MTGGTLNKCPAVIYFSLWENGPNGPLIWPGARESDEDLNGMNDGDECWG